MLKQVENTANFTNTNNLIKFVEILYEKGYSAKAIMETIEVTNRINKSKKYGLLIHFDDIRREFRNEKLLMLYILTLTFLRPDCDLENIQEM